jgi:hypothetical protein
MRKYLITFCILISVPLICFSKEIRNIELKDLGIQKEDEKFGGRAPQSIDLEIEQDLKNEERYQKLREFSDRMMELREPNPTREY